MKIKTKGHHPQMSTYISHPKTEERFSIFLLSPPNITYIQPLLFESQGGKYNSCPWSDYWVLLYWCFTHVVPTILWGITSILTSLGLDFLNLKQHHAFRKWSWDSNPDLRSPIPHSSGHTLQINKGTCGKPQPCNQGVPAQLLSPTGP